MEAFENFLNPVHSLFNVTQEAKGATGSSYSISHIYSMNSKNNRKSGRVPCLQSTVRFVVCRIVAARWHNRLTAIVTYPPSPSPSDFLLFYFGCIFDGADSGGACAAEVRFHSEMARLSLAPSFNPFTMIYTRCFAVFALLFVKTAEINLTRWP